MSLNIVLLEPEIPQNTGNIARTCAATNINLHLIKPMGFSIDDKHVKRAGLDYWHLVTIQVYENWEDFTEKNPQANCYFASTKSLQKYTDVSYQDNDYLVFGKETRGLPEELLKENKDKCVRIPMASEARSLNLANSVAIMAYEALRQLDFPELQDTGELAHLHW